MTFSSLRLRLIVGFIILTLVCWTAAALSAWFQTRHNINELFDTQQMLFARQLTMIDPQDLSTASTSLPNGHKLERKHRGELEDEALAFAIFTREGKMVLNDGENGKDFPFLYTHNGFTDGPIKNDDDPWRIIWLNTPDEHFIVAVGQEWEYRQDMVLDIMQTTLLPWLIALPVMMLLMFLLVTLALAPLKRIAAQLRQRKPDDGAPLDTPPDTPQEVRPLVDELNQFFTRMSAMLTLERRFTSDAAHELRSPLSALKVQADVAQLAHDDEPLRRHALANLDAGIARASRLIDQLLTLSRLDTESTLAQQQTVRLQEVVQQAVIDHYANAQAQGTNLILHMPDAAVVRSGNPLLLTVLLRNLLDNAIRYGGKGGEVCITLAENTLRVEDNGPGIAPNDMPRVGERFFRPPGQEQPGSGLGLSIAQNIARLHGMRIRFANRPQGGFSATVDW